MQIQINLRLRTIIFGRINSNGNCFAWWWMIFFIFVFAKENPLFEWRPASGALLVDACPLDVDNRTTLARTTTKTTKASDDNLRLDTLSCGLFKSCSKFHSFSLKIFFFFFRTIATMMMDLKWKCSSFLLLKTPFCSRSKRFGYTIMIICVKCRRRPSWSDVEWLNKKKHLRNITIEANTIEEQFEEFLLLPTQKASKLSIGTSAIQLERILQGAFFSFFFFFLNAQVYSKGKKRSAFEC